MSIEGECTHEHTVKSAVSAIVARGGGLGSNGERGKGEERSLSEIDTRAVVGG